MDNTAKDAQTPTSQADVSSNTNFNDSSVMIELEEGVQRGEQIIKKVLPRISTPQIFEKDIDNLEPADLVSLGAGVASFFANKKMRQEVQESLQHNL